MQLSINQASSTAFHFQSQDSRMSLHLCLLSPSSTALSLPPHWTFLSVSILLGSLFYFFHAELEFVKKQTNSKNTQTHKGKKNTTWIGDLKTQTLGSRVLSLFLKGTCTFTAWAILCIAATIVSSDRSVYLFILSGQEAKLLWFLWVMSAYMWNLGCLNESYRACIKVPLAFSYQCTSSFVM